MKGDEVTGAYKIQVISGTAPVGWKLIDGPVGSSGARHNVAVMQLALSKVPVTTGRKRYWSEAVSGRASPNLAAAIGQFQAAYGLRASGRVQPGDGTEKALLKLLPAKLKRLRGVAGTATVLIYPQHRRPAQISGGDLVSTKLRGKLGGLLSDLAATHGFPFDAEVKSWPANRRILTATIQPRKIDAFHQGRWVYINDERTLHRIAGPLHQKIESDLKTRAGILFGIKDRADLEVQRSLHQRLAIVVGPEVDAILAKYQGYLARGKSMNLTFAVKMLSHYLSARGTAITISRDEALSLNIVKEAAADNIDRFRELNFETPDAGNAALQAFESLRNSAKKRCRGQ